MLQFFFNTKKRWWSIVKVIWKHIDKKNTSHHEQSLECPIIQDLLSWYQDVSFSFLDYISNVQGCLVVTLVWFRGVHWNKFFLNFNLIFSPPINLIFLILAPRQHVLIPQTIVKLISLEACIFEGFEILVHICQKVFMCLSFHHLHIPSLLGAIKSK